MDREAWRAVIHGVANSRTWLSDWTELNWTTLCLLVGSFNPLSFKVILDIWSYCCCSVAQLCLTLCDPIGITGLTISWSLLKFMSIASVMPFSHLVLWLPLLLLSSIFPSIRDFPNESYYLFLNWLGLIFCRFFPSPCFLPKEIPLAVVIKLVWL